MTKWNLKGNYIVEYDSYLGMLTVFYNGDEYVFDTLEEAELFIAEMEKTEADIEASYSVK